MNQISYALIKGNDVINLALFDTPSESLLALFKEQFQVDSIIPADINAAVGGTYDGNRFWPIQPFPSWIKNEEAVTWVAPTPMPTDGKQYTWDEPTLSWKAN